jgi:prepilin-type N-terminal cleavage/methylation domain-containing protein
MRKAFTLIELTVAVGLLAMMISFASLIFDMSIDTHRMAMASAEIMQKLQAITGQLNADFKSQSINLPGKVLFRVVGQTRSDSIVFFANGDFQSTGQHKTGSDEKTVAGNIAAIYYGLVDVNTIDPRKNVLVRRQTILTADTDFDPCDVQQYGEYWNYWNGDDGMSPSKLIAKDTNSISVLLDTLLAKEGLVPQLTYLAEGVDNFTIQFAEWNGLKFVWMPKDESEFDKYEVINSNAFKFTFTLYDSKGILKDGKTFTHIVYLGD